MATMEQGPQRTFRGARTNGHVDGGGSGRRAHHGNKRWVADGVTGRSGASTPYAGSDGERWERGGHRGSGRGRGRGGRGKYGNASVTFRRNGALDGGATGSEGEHSEVEEENGADETDMNDPETPEEREIFWHELVKAREVERKRAIAEGKMDDPLKPKRLEDAITMVGTCVDMCPRFERYRRERENNLFEWETIPGTKRVDHRRAVKAYERAAGDKTLPSDLRPPDVLRHTLDYLFHELLPLGGFSETFNFIRDRSRAVRNDFTMQHEMGAIAIECHDRCARFHILALHIERDRSGFSIAMEEQQLMNTLQSLKEFYQDQRDNYQSPSELEMRVYHRLVHIRDQKERHDDIPQTLLNNPVFELTTKFRARVQAKSAPITKTSPLAVDAEAMQIFAELANVLRREGNIIMTYLVACILERHFGKDTIENIESIRGSLSLSDIIDGAFLKPDIGVAPFQPPAAPVQSAFSNLKTIPNAFGTTSFGTQSAFTDVKSTVPPVSVFGPINNSSTPAPSSQRATEAFVAPVHSLAPPLVSSFSPFLPMPAGAQAMTFAPQGEKPSQSTPFFISQPSQVNGTSFTPTRKPTFGSEISPTRSLNPLAPNFTPKPSFGTPPSASGFGIPSTSAFNISSPVTAPIWKERSFPSPQPAQEQSIPETAASEIPLVSSPPSTGSAPIEAEQTPPAQPPPLNRRQPISLPSTPTASTFIPPSLPPTRKSTLENLQTSSLSAVPTEILSPLVLQSPFSKSHASIPSLLRRESTQSPLKAVVSAADIEALAEPAAEKPNADVATGPSQEQKPSLDIMKATALHFSRRSSLVKQVFSLWQERLKQHVKWVEACQRSARYKEKVQAERLSRSVGSSPAQNGRKQRRSSSETRPPLKKRLRERLSGEYRRPTNDEELARRFEKNHEDHARRWARGSFLCVLRNVLASMSRPVPDNWSAWLSFNQENDGTAIWLEQKFDVPDSGEWKNDSVFQIPISKDHVELARSYPGVIVFERTPLTGVADLLGRKYHVLEDCTRLREIIEAFPAERHYLPTLLCVAWSERDPDSSKDFDDMVVSMVEGGMLTSTHELMFSTAASDMESKLEKLLQVVPFDLEGRLVKRVSLNDLFKIWEHLWEETTTRWLGNCVIYGEFNWDLYAKLLEGCTRLWIQVVNSVTSLLRGADGVSSNLVQLQLVKGMNSDTTFDVVLTWLEALPETEYSASLMGDVRAHRDLGRDFPTMTFLSQLYALARSVAAHLADTHAEVANYVSRSRLDDASRELERLKASFEEEMNACHIAKFKPPKRVASTSSSRTSTPRSKKQRLSFSEESPTDEETSSAGSPSSPSLSNATSVSSEPTIVTSAMLRSLTKEIRTKYGAAQANVLSASAYR